MAVGMTVPVPDGLELVEMPLDEVEDNTVVPEGHWVGNVGSIVVIIGILVKMPVVGLGSVALPPLVVPLPVAVPLPVVVSAMVRTKLEPSRTRTRPRQRFLGAMTACEG